MKSLQLLFVLGLLVFSTPVLAQVDPFSITAPSEEIVLSPRNPAPGELVTATVNVYSPLLRGAEINWRINGQPVPDSTNKREVVIEAGEAGSITEISAVLTPSQGAQRIMNAQIRPVYLDIILEAQTRTPEFYLGRSLPSIKSAVNAIALLDNGSRMTGEYLYTWKLGQTVLEGGPIRNRNAVTFEIPTTNASALSLEVSRLDGTVIASRSVRVPSVLPQLVFYETNALYGPSHIALSNTFNLVGASAMFRAEPYYLDVRSYNEPEVRAWRVDTTQVEGPKENPYEITIQRTGEESASANISFEVLDIPNVLQAVKSGIVVTY